MRELGFFGFGVTLPFRSLSLCLWVLLVVGIWVVSEFHSLSRYLVLVFSSFSFFFSLKSVSGPLELR